MKRQLCTVLSVLMLLAALSGCVQEETPKTGLAADFAVEISGEGVEITLTAADMQAREQETITCTNIESSGNVNEVTVSGFSLRKVLDENGIVMDGLASINLIAADGYSIIVPSEYYAESDVYILLSFEGDNLEHPRSCLPDQRAMYWVRDLIKIELMGKNTVDETQKDIVSRIDIFREGVKELNAVTLSYMDLRIPAYSLKEYCEKYDISLPQNTVTLRARDGYEKVETAESFLDNYVALESDNADDLPFYFSEEMKSGMSVKQLEYVICGGNAVYFGFETSVSGLFEAMGMAKADTYIFTAGDGFEVNIPYDAIEFGKIYADEKEGFIRAEFEGYDFGGAKGGGKVKYLVSIKAAQ
ncbi:MAG: hypothetical protein WDA65_05460 [Christensenellales bacterium]